MKKALFIGAVVIISLLIIYAIVCVTVTSTSHFENEQLLNVTHLYSDGTSADGVYGMSYIIDNDTDVVYFLIRGSYYASMTPKLKTDGTPMTATELGLQREDANDDKEEHTVECFR